MLPDGGDSLVCAMVSDIPGQAEWTSSAVGLHIANADLVACVNP